MSENARVANELVLNPSEYAFTQDLTSGVMKTHTGPSVVNITGQEYPVSFDPKTGRFRKVSLADAPVQFVLAQQGQYVILNNPSVDGKHPSIKDKAIAPELKNGQRVNIQGPITFALWPGQSAEVVDGHNLRSNQYLRIRIRDEQGAKDNWSKSLIRAANAAESESTDSSQKKGTQKPVKMSFFDKVPDDLAVGKHYIVRGDEFSFYIPPTGVEVLKDANGSYVRDATTLERLEYSILIDENGSKRYERGPMVVFPRPTERFYEETDKEGNPRTVFHPIELNEIQGLHVKVISEYIDEDGILRKEGEELFIRGDKTPIYFPRPEHSLVTYDRKHKHFATAVPPGEARYVLERNVGVVKTVKGPTMLLPDPRKEVIVRRVLTEKECNLWYPGNADVEKYNSALREMAKATSSTRGAISEGEVMRSKKLKTAGLGVSSQEKALGFADRATTNSDTYAIGADEFERGSTYNEPRTLTLDTKFSGVPTINLWTGYAVMVVSADPNAKVNRRVEIGPKRLLLDYDETLEVLSMSTGKPKNTDQLIRTVYLRVKNNQVGDVIRAETKDHVNVECKVSLNGNFTGDPNKWFEVENYVKLMCDRVRSTIKAAVRKKTVEELYADPTAILQEAVLGAKDSSGSRLGMVFEENGFHLTEMEVLGFVVGDERIAKILDNTQHQVVEGNIGLALAERKLVIEKRNEELNRERAEAVANTQRVNQMLSAELDKFTAELAIDRVARELRLETEKANSVLAQLKKKEETSVEDQRIKDVVQSAELARKKTLAAVENEIQAASQELQLAKSVAETEAIVARFTAASGPFAEALVALQSQETLVRIAEATGIQRYIGGDNLVDSIRKIFAGTPVAGLLEGAVNKSMVSSWSPASAPAGNGSAKPVDVSAPKR